ncbi:hypothetical protein GCM10009761_27860 [Agromyces terreus]
MLALQRSAGNQATTAYVQRSVLDDLWNRGLFDGSMLAQADPGLPRSLISHYMSAAGAAYALTRAEMIEVDAFTNVFSWFPAIAAERNRLIAAAEADPAPPSEFRQFTAVVSGARGRGAAQKNQTLGNFTVTLEGTLTVTKGPTGALAEFTGTATYYDYWDFDPKPMATFVDGTSGRSTAGELKTWVGALMEGTPFAIDSADTVAVSQHQFDDHAAIT